MRLQHAFGLRLQEASLLNPARDVLDPGRLRVVYANDRYEELTGEPSPVRGGDPRTDPTDPQARREVTARLGHARASITHAYYGKASPATAEVPIPPRAEAQCRLSVPHEAICPSGMAISTWLRKVYDLLRQVGQIGIPGAPTLKALQDPDAPTPIVLDREQYLLQRARLRPPSRHD